MELYEWTSIKIDYFVNFLLMIERKDEDYKEMYGDEDGEASNRVKFVPPDHG